MSNLVYPLVNWSNGIVMIGVFVLVVIVLIVMILFLIYGGSKNE